MTDLPTTIEPAELEPAPLGLDDYPDVLIQLIRNYPDAAVCRGRDPDDYFPERKFLLEDDGYAAALCAGCPFTAACLLHALRHGIRHGIWGGTNPDTRDRIHRQAYRDPDVYGRALRWVSALGAVAAQ